MHRLGAQDAIVVAHSFGVLPAMALALQHERYAKALVLLAGCYFPGASVGELGQLAPSLPVIGPLARLTLAPSLARAATPDLVAAMFEPQPPTPAFVEGAPLALACRPSQIAAAAEDTRAIERATSRFAPHYPRIGCRTAVITGSGDGIFDPDAQSRRFAEMNADARLVVVPAAGHMVHHTAASRIVAAIRAVARGRFVGDDKGPPPDGDADTLGDPPAPQRPRKTSANRTRERRKTS
jgi:pimeloyl-ACP methyl ester carboxylesterase